MSTSLDSFKRTLATIPKFNYGPEFNVGSIYSHYLVTEKRYLCETIIGNKLEKQIAGLRLT